MPRVLFLVNLLEDGLYRCHVRVAFDSARKLQQFLSRHSVREKDGWSLFITQGPSRGYDGKPLYHADIWLSTRLSLPELPPLPSSHEPTDFMVNDGGPKNTYGTGVWEKLPQERQREHLTWEERTALQQASNAVLRQLGVADLGRWK